jgi:signal transduction histidine kinase
VPVAGGGLQGAWPPIVTVFLVVLATASNVLEPGELILRDAVLRAEPRQLAAAVVAVVIDEEAIRRVGAWPWTRYQIATLIDRIREAGAVGVAVDVLLPEPREGDAALATSLSFLPSVLAAAPDDRGRWLLPAPALRGIADAAHVSFELDRDGVVRGFLASRELQGRPLTAFPVAAARLLRPDMPVPVGAAIRPGFRAGDAVPTVGAAMVMDERTPAGALRGRICFVGASAAGIGDRVVSPVSPRGTPEPGVLVQAAASEAILEGDLLRRVPPLVAGGLAGLVALGGMSLRQRGRRFDGLLPVAAALLPVPLGVVSLVLLRMELPVISMTLGGVVVSGGLELRRLLVVRRQSSEAARRIQELEALAASFEGVQRDDAEARRVVAHELRTPLTSVRGLAQLLSGFDLSEVERKRVAGMVVQETSRLSDMVEALLDLERLKLKDFRRVAVPVALSRVVRERTNLLGSGSGRDLRVQCEPDVTVVGDAVLLGRVVDNLVGNALKFAPPEEPVDVTLRTSGVDGVALEVRDRGPGVPPEERDAIFRRFARGGSAATIPGLGLGLALVSEVARWHGGRIEFEAPSSGGSLFRVILPARAGPRELGRRA